MCRNVVSLKKLFCALRHQSVTVFEIKWNNKHKLCMSASFCCTGKILSREEQCFTVI